MEKYNLDYENKLLNLLGYSCKLNNQNELIIFDDNNKEVGYIEIDNSSEDIKYHTVIDSDTIKFNKVRTFNPESYWIDVKDVGYVLIRLDRKNYLPGDAIFSIVSDKYGRYNVYCGKSSRGIKMDNLGENGLKFSCGYKVGNYSVLECVDFRNKEYNDSNLFKSYEYRLSYYNILSKEATKKGTALFAFSSSDNSNLLFTNTRRYEFTGDKYIEELSASSKKIQTIEEFAIEHNRGIELFNELRKLCSEILPFKKDVLCELFDNQIDELGLTSFFNEEKETFSK